LLLRAPPRGGWSCVASVKRASSERSHLRGLVGALSWTQAELNSGFLAVHCLIPGCSGAQCLAQSLPAAGAWRVRRNLSAWSMAGAGVAGLRGTSAATVAATAPLRVYRHALGERIKSVMPVSHVAVAVAVRTAHGGRRHTALPRWAAAACCRPPQLRPRCQGFCGTPLPRWPDAEAPSPHSHDSRARRGAAIRPRFLPHAVSVRASPTARHAPAARAPARGHSTLGKPPRWPASWHSRACCWRCACRQVGNRVPADARAGCGCPPCARGTRLIDQHAPARSIRRGRRNRGQVAPPHRPAPQGRDQHRALLPRASHQGVPCGRQGGRRAAQRARAPRPRITPIITLAVPRRADQGGAGHPQRWHRGLQHLGHHGLPELSL
jgi:hypothetical protein